MAIKKNETCGSCKFWKFVRLDGEFKIGLCSKEGEVADCSWCGDWKARRKVVK